MKISVHAGHNSPGMIGCGAVGIVDESAEAREIAARLTDLLDINGFDVKNITVDGAKSASDVLLKLTERNNQYAPDLAISIHLNAFTDPNVNGAEVYINDMSYNGLAFEILNNLPFKNRGIKTNKHLYILNRFNCPTILLELGFCTNAKDCRFLNEYDIEDRILDAICAYYKHTPAEEANETTMFRVISQKLSRKDADALAQRLTEQGIYAEIEED